MSMRRSQKIVQTLTYAPPDDGEMWFPRTYTGYQLYYRPKLSEKRKEKANGGVYPEKKR